jgi:hypothetical protein
MILRQLRSVKVWPVPGLPGYLPLPARADQGLSMAELTAI